MPLTLTARPDAFASSWCMAVQIRPPRSVPRPGGPDLGRDLVLKAALLRSPRNGLDPLSLALRPQALKPLAIVATKGYVARGLIIRPRAAGGGRAPGVARRAAAGGRRPAGPPSAARGHRACRRVAGCSRPAIMITPRKSATEPRPQMRMISTGPPHRSPSPPAAEGTRLCLFLIMQRSCDLYEGLRAPSRGGVPPRAWREIGGMRVARRAGERMAIRVDDRATRERHYDGPRLMGFAAWGRSTPRSGTVRSGPSGERQSQHQADDWTRTRRSPQSLGQALARLDLPPCRRRGRQRGALAHALSECDRQRVEDHAMRGPMAMNLNPSREHLDELAVVLRAFPSSASAPCPPVCWAPTGSGRHHHPEVAHDLLGGRRLCGGYEDRVDRPCSRQCLRGRHVKHSDRRAADRVHRA